MKRNWLLKTISILLCLCMLGSYTAFAEEPRTSHEIMEKLTAYFKAYDDEAEQAISELLEELSVVDPAAGVKWESIMLLWKTVGDRSTIHEKADGRKTKSSVGAICKVELLSLRRNTLNILSRAGTMRSSEAMVCRTATVPQR